MRSDNLAIVIKGIAILFLVLSLSHYSHSGIVGSAHDFTSTGKYTQWNPYTENEICIFCHTPHLSTADGPLWNHELTSTVFTLYQSSSLNSTMSQPSGVSKLCLSCHDGTVAINQYRGGNPADDGRTAMFTPGVHANLMNDHPVSFLYDSDLANTDGALHNPSIVTTNNGGTIDEDLLIEGKVECSSCHDVHNKYFNNNSFGLLKISRNSLCLTCHNP